MKWIHMIMNHDGSHHCPTSTFKMFIQNDKRNLIKLHNNKCISQTQARGIFMTSKYDLLTCWKVYAKMDVSDCHLVHKYCKWYLNDRKSIYRQYNVKYRLDKRTSSKLRSRLEFSNLSILKACFDASVQYIVGL